MFTLIQILNREKNIPTHVLLRKHNFNLHLRKHNLMPLQSSHMASNRESHCQWIRTLIFPFFNLHPNTTWGKDLNSFPSFKVGKSLNTIFSSPIFFLRTKTWNTRSNREYEGKPSLYATFPILSKIRNEP